MHARESPFHLATLRAHPQGIHSWPELHHILFKLDAVVLEQELLFLRGHSVYKKRIEIRANCRNYCSSNLRLSALLVYVYTFRPPLHSGMFSELNKPVLSYRS